jgi:phosphoserine phosphatase
VAAPVAIDPDEILADYAKQKGWPVMTLRDTSGKPVPLES